MQPKRTIQPEFTPFVIWRKAIIQLLVLSAVAAVATAAMHLADISTTGWVWLLAASMYFLTVADSVARYKKTRTEIYETRIVHKSGTLISNHETTLNIANITHVTHKKPWLEHKLFGTSDVHIECAGSQSTEAHIQSAPHAKAIYADIQDVMRQNGFALSKKQLLQEEKPVKAAVVIKTLVGTAVTLFIAAGPALALIFALVAANPALLVLVLPGILWAAALPVLRILDHTRREYRVYSDCIDYEEGFLTTTDSIIPAENLAESNNTQGLLDRLLGTSNIQISTQGTGTIQFRHMPHGAQLEETIDSMAKRYQPLVRAGARKNPRQPAKQVQEQPSKSATRFTASYKQHLPRALAPVIGILTALVIAAVVVANTRLRDLFFTEVGFTAAVWISGVVLIGGVQNILKALVTDYEIRTNGVWEKFSFIRRTTQEFTDDKLVGLVIRQNPIDRLFGTARIEFQSLSKAPNITFRHIKDSQKLIQKLRKKYYLDTPHQETIHAKYRIRYAFARHLLSILGLAALLALTAAAAAHTEALTERTAVIAAAALITAAAGIALLQAALRHLTYTDSSLKLHEEHLEHTVGYFFVKNELVRYEDIKTQAATEYRLTPVGGLYLDVGGSNLQGESNKQVAKPNGFTADYLPAPTTHQDHVDKQLTGTAGGNTLMRTKRDYANHVITHTLFFPLLVILPITLWRVSKWRYELQETRIHEYYGVWNKRTRTLAYRNIDHVNEKRGFTNKLANNGSVTVQTLGSGLTIKNIQDYTQWREAIENQYH